MASELAQAEQDLEAAAAAVFSAHHEHGCGNFVTAAMIRYGTALRAWLEAGGRPDELEREFADDSTV